MLESLTALPPSVFERNMPESTAKHVRTEGLELLVSGRDGLNSGLAETAFLQRKKARQKKKKLNPKPFTKAILAG